ncbi:MAG TPA: hypothetical protein GX396_06415 [Tissierellia bacterium]|jgi:hypothetical protein|nr:hypothetical protein [Tissierellia bacterium]
MSAFLGPIHYWLYNKIKIQNDIVEEILDYADEQGINIRTTAYEKFGDGELKPLEEVIDVTNIHGWLQERVSRVENKLAFAVTKLLQVNPESLDSIKNIFKNKGAEVSTFNKDTKIEEIYKALNDTLLDGMPCDHAISVIYNDDNEIIWRRNTCVHEQYWKAHGGDIKNYYLLRDEFIKGLLGDTGVKYEKLDEITGKIYR